jgi:CO/xanthine dehydrogenase FAD-binding subunit
MHPFTLERPRDLATALAFGAQAGRNDATAEYIAGGTDRVQLLQEYVRRPDRLVSLTGFSTTGLKWDRKVSDSARRRRWPTSRPTAMLSSSFR